MKKVKSVLTNGKNGIKFTYTVGEEGVLAIEQHCAQGEGDKWYYDVILKDHTIRIFSFDAVILDN